MKTVHFKAKGTKAFLFHRFNIETITNTKKVKEGSSGNNPMEWKETIWSDGKKLYVPGFYMHSALGQGGKYVKIGRGTLSKHISSAVTVMDERIYFNRTLDKPIEELTFEDMSKDSSHPIYLDIRGVCNPNTKGKNVRYRVAMSPGWEFSCELQWDDSIVSKDQLKQCVESLGKLVGFSNGRTLGYGRFEIIEFNVK